MRTYRFAYVIDGVTGYTGTVDTHHASPQRLAEALARLPKAPPYDGCTVRVWANPHANPNTPPDAEVTPS